MKRYIILSIICTILISGMAFGAKYKVNTSGAVKNQQGTVIKQSQNPYSVYTPSTYNAKTQTSSSQVQYIDLVMDYSGSMSRWIEQAKRTMTSIIAQIPSSTKVGLRAFGQATSGINTAPQMGTVTGTKKVNGKIQVITKSNQQNNSFTGCTATSKLVTLSNANSATLIMGMNSAQIGGSTPMVYGMQRAVAEDFTGYDRTSPKKLILVTDGGENCGGDPCKFAKELMRQRSDIHIDVILVDSGSNRLSCLATTTGGHIYKVNDISKFSTVLTQSMQAQPKTSTTTAPAKTRQQQYEYYKD